MAVSFPIKLRLLENMTKRNKGGLGSVCQKESVQIHSVFHVNEKKCGKNQGCLFLLPQIGKRFSVRFVTFTGKSEAKPPRQPSNAMSATMTMATKKEVFRNRGLKTNVPTYDVKMHLHHTSKITHDVV